MKKILFAASLIITSLAVQAQDTPRHKKPKETKDVNVLDITKNQGTTIEYKTPAELKAELEKKADLNMWSADQKEKYAATIPTGGYLILKISRSTIDAANPRLFTVVAQDETGKEIYRAKQKDETPDYRDVNGLTVWESLSGVIMPAELKTGAKVYVIDPIKEARYEFLIQN